MRLDRSVFAPVLLSALTACGGELGDSSAQGQAQLVTACAAAHSDVPEGEWVCGEDRVVECEGPQGTAIDDLWVVEANFGPGTMLCGGPNSLEVSDAGPYAAGTHVIEVHEVDAAGASTLLCSSELEVQDTLPPEVETVEQNLWPPNHKYREIRPEDCVIATDRCDGELHMAFVWASSDEPQNGQGDGNHEPDIIELGCDSVKLRAERSGNNNGRVYRLGVRVSDDEGHSVDTECLVTVVHDQSGSVAIDDGEDHRLELAEDACEDTTSNGSGGNGTGGSGGGSGGSGGGSGLPPGGF